MEICRLAAAASVCLSSLMFKIWYRELFGVTEATLHLIFGIKKQFGAETDVFKYSGANKCALKT